MKKKGVPKKTTDRGSIEYPSSQDRRTLNDNSNNNNSSSSRESEYLADVQRENNLANESTNNDRSYLTKEQADKKVNKSNPPKDNPSEFGKNKNSGKYRDDNLDKDIVNNNNSKEQMENSNSFSKGGRGISKRESVSAAAAAATSGRTSAMENNYPHKRGEVISDGNRDDNDDERMNNNNNNKSSMNRRNRQGHEGKELMNKEIGNGRHLQSHISQYSRNKRGSAAQRLARANTLALTTTNRSVNANAKHIHSATPASSEEEVEKLNIFLRYHGMRIPFTFLPI